jgi:hypothetical protein
MGAERATVLGEPHVVILATVATTELCAGVSLVKSAVTTVVLVGTTVNIDGGMADIAAAGAVGDVIAGGDMYAPVVA